MSDLRIVTGSSIARDPDGKINCAVLWNADWCHVLDDVAEPWRHSEDVLAVMETPLEDFLSTLPAHVISNHALSPTQGKVRAALQWRPLKRHACTL